MPDMFRVANAETRAAMPKHSARRPGLWSRNTGNSLPVLGNSRWIPVAEAELVSQASLNRVGRAEPVCGLLGVFRLVLCHDIGRDAAAVVDAQVPLPRPGAYLLVPGVVGVVLRTRAGRPGVPGTLRAALT
ncbi:MAG: hypothetical protein JWM19_6761 [Actinomycetia bacterium]|nr:hypothetical protein [Actinomycetes bacterium]